MIRADYYSYSDAGRREENEDCAIAFTSGRTLCAIVADGLGGQGRGSEAAGIAVRELAELARGGMLPMEPDILMAMSEVNNKIDRIRANRLELMTTAVCLYISGRKAIWAHAGDSRLYHLYRGHMIEYTLDHSAAQYAVMAGEITREEIPTHSGRSILMRALGSDELEPEVHERVLSPGMHGFLLCTDGFWENISDHEIVRAARAAKSAKEWINILRNLVCARMTNDADNNTAIAVFINI